MDFVFLPSYYDAPWVRALCSFGTFDSLAFLDFFAESWEWQKVVAISVSDWNPVESTQPVDQCHYIPSIINLKPEP
jgi:hypothetical protein